MLGTSYWRQLIIIAHEKRPWAARSGVYGSRFGLAGPQGIRAAFRAGANEVLREAYTLSLLPIYPPTTPRLSKQRVFIARSARQEASGTGGGYTRAFSEVAEGHLRKTLAKPSYWTENRSPLPARHPLIASKAA